MIEKTFKDTLFTLWYIIRFPIQLVLILLLYILSIIGYIFGVQIIAKTTFYHSHY